MLSYSCSNIKYDRLAYYSGNFSAHPELRYLIDINIFDSTGIINYSIGENISNITTKLTEQQRKDLKSAIRKISMTTNTKSVIDDIPSNGIQLFKNDSMVYYTSWNYSYDVNKKVISLEKNIKKLIPPVDSILSSQ
jgi:hypothetical protein